MGTTVRGCAGKQRHETRADARAHAASLFLTYRYKGHAYRCHLCGFWHVGRSHRKRR